MLALLNFNPKIMHGIEQPITHVTKDEVLLAAEEVERGADLGADSGADIDMRSAVEGALAKVSFYPMYGERYADLRVVMANIGGVLGENREAFEECLGRIISEENGAYFCPGIGNVTELRQNRESSHGGHEEAGLHQSAFGEVQECAVASMS